MLYTWKWNVLLILSSLVLAENHTLDPNYRSENTDPIILDNSNVDCPKGFPIPKTGIPPGAVFVGKEKKRFVIPVKEGDLQEGDLFVTSRKEEKEDPYSVALGGLRHTQMVIKDQDSFKTMCSRKVGGAVWDFSDSREVMRLKPGNDKLRNETMKRVKNWKEYLKKSGSTISFTESPVFSDDDFKLVYRACEGEDVPRHTFTTYCSNAATFPYQVSIKQSLMSELPRGEASFTALETFWSEIDKSITKGKSDESAIEAEFEKLIEAATDMIDGRGKESFREYKNKNGGKDWEKTVKKMKLLRYAPYRVTVTKEFLKSYNNEMPISPADLVIGSRNGVGPFEHVGTLVSPKCPMIVGSHN